MDDKNTHHHGVRKIKRIHGALVGCAGYVVDALIFWEWVRDGADQQEFPKLGQPFNAIAVSRDGKISTFDGYSQLPVPQLPYAAIGTGIEIALGALYAGADAITAVRAAIKHDAGSKPPIRIYRL